MTVKEVAVVKAVSAPVRPASVRRVLARATEVPEIRARVGEERREVAVRITDDSELERLNRTYAGDAHATDVLAFAGGGAHLGDVAISWPAVVRQAHMSGHPPEAELSLLCVHALLHLLGWDHRTARERKEMTRLTVAALARSRIELAPGRL